jgi:erythromycin esterase-like protein/predicted phosphoribosyltransferase
MAFRDRVEAGRVLGRKLGAYRGRSDVLVLGLPRGGVPVAEPVAEALAAPLDVFVVRKLGVPGHEELAMGAVATGGVRVRNEDVVRRLRITEKIFAGVARVEEEELVRRERAYRENAPPLVVERKTVILVDDGLATGATMRAAVEALRARRAAKVVVAVPVGATESCAEMARLVDDIVCAETPEPFQAVGLWYNDFSQTTDDEVRAILARSRAAGPAPGGQRTVDAHPLPTGPVAACRRLAQPLVGKDNDYDRLLSWAANADVVLLGEASHGTHEFYKERAEITKRLILEYGFIAVAAEADWPDAYRINRFVRGQGPDEDALGALGGFARFPAWMWRNADVLDFIGWLRRHNDSVGKENEKAGFYGLDIYSLYSSMEAVIDFLDRVDPAAAGRARRRYACFEQKSPVGSKNDGQEYGAAAGLGLAASCEQEVVAQLRELRRHATEFASASPLGADEFFFAEQNARVAQNAEAYYRAMFGDRAVSWNLRDRHMMDTLEALVRHLHGTAGRSKIVVWAHNSHLGDARATDMVTHGELNLGQLVRESFGESFKDRAALIGMTTYAGTVTAASAWGGPVDRKTVRPALPGSYEAVFHDVGLPRFLLDLRDDDADVRVLEQPRLERAIGVIYLPETERASHYFHARLPHQFDAVIHIDKTQALIPLERKAGRQSGDLPETYPSAV